MKKFLLVKFTEAQISRNQKSTADSDKNIKLYIHIDIYIYKYLNYLPTAERC